MPKSLKAKINAVNKWFAEVADIFGVESVEFSYFKKSYEQSFKRVPLKINGKVHLESPDFRYVTSTNDKGVLVIDRDAISYSTSGANKAYRQVYEEILDRALRKFERKYSLYKMASYYTYTTPTGIKKTVQSLAIAKKYKEQIRNKAHIRYRLEIEGDKNLYEKIEEIEDDATREYFKRKLRKIQKKSRKLISTKTELLELEIELEEYFVNQISEMKEKDRIASAERDEIPTSAEDILGGLTIRSAR